MIRIGTRGSALALAQAHWVAARLAGATEIVTITTSGDRGAQDEDKSRWVTELERALLDDEIDVAVHSAKDVPAQLPGGLELVAIPERADPRDALCGADSLGALVRGPAWGRAACAAPPRSGACAMTSTRPGRPGMSIPACASSLRGRSMRWCLPQPVWAASGMPPTACSMSSSPLPGRGRWRSRPDPAASPRSCSMPSAIPMPQRASPSSASSVVRSARAATAPSAPGRVAWARTRSSYRRGWGGPTGARGAATGSVDPAEGLGSLCAERMLGAGAGELLEAG